MSTNIKKVNTKTDERADKLKLFSIGSVVILAAIILLANFLFDKIFGQALTFDFSAYSSNTISDVTQNYLDSLPEGTNIRIVGLFNRPENVAGTEYQYIAPLLDDYVKKSDGKVTLEYIDPTERPSIIKSLDPTNSYDLASKTGAYVLQYNGRIKLITPLDCYVYDQDYYYSTGVYYITDNNTEYAFTNAMHALTAGFKCKAYIISGLKESGNEGISTVLESMAVDVIDLPVSDSFAVPDDCDLLILNGPNTDITEKMYVSMSDYLKRGGKIFIAVDYTTFNTSERFEHLNKLTAEMNIGIEDALIYENDPNYQLNGSAIDSAVTLNPDFYYLSSVTSFYSAFARPVKDLTGSGSSALTGSLLMTSANSSAIIVNADGNILDSGSGTEGTHSVAMYSRDPGTNGEIYVFGTTNFTSDDFIEAYGYNDSNVDFFRNCVKDLLDSAVVLALDVQTKSVDNFSINTEKATATTATIILAVFLIVIPIALMALAVIVYTKRKNL